MRVLLAACLALGAAAARPASLLSSKKAGSDVDVDSPAGDLGALLMGAESQWVSAVQSALNNSFKGLTTAVTQAHVSCANVSLSMVKSVKGHKNGLVKRMHGVCNVDGLAKNSSHAFCQQFSDGLLAALFDDPVKNVPGQLDGELGAFCGHFFESTIRPMAEARQKDDENRAQKKKDRSTRIQNTLRVLTEAEKQVKAQNKPYPKPVQEHKAPEPAPAAHTSSEPAPTAAEVTAAQKLAEQEGGAKGLAEEIKHEEESNHDASSEVVRDALAIDVHRDDPLPYK